MRASVALLTTALACAVFLPSEGHAQVRPETIRGNVTTDSGVAVVAVEVLVTMAPDRLVFRARTDSNGRYRIQIPNGTGDYLIHFSAVGRRTFRKRVTRADSTQVEFVVHAQLAADVQELPAVSVTGIRGRPQRAPNLGAETGASERSVDGVPAAISPDAQGDLSAMLATIPGVQLTSAGVSVLGLDPSQTQKTLNGLAFAGDDIPRDVRSRTRLYTSSFDPARGGFSGGQASIEISPGNVFGFRRSHIMIDHPALQYSDEVTSRIGPRPTRFGLSAGGDGEIVENKLYYNVAGQVKHETDLSSTIVDADDAVLDLAGIEADSAERLITLLQAAHIPVERSGRTSTKVSTDANFVARIDYKPFETAFFNSTKATWGVLAYGKFQEASPIGLSPTRTATHATMLRNVTGMLQATNAFYWGRGYLTDTRAAFTTASNKRHPYSQLPEGRVLVQSAPGGEPNAVWAEFGGDQSPAGNSASWTLETTSTTQLYSPWGDGRHQLKLFAQSRFDGFSRTEVPSGGTFSYLSLVDLAANNPAMFIRSAPGERQPAQGWNGALAIGDSWRKSQTFSLLYGLRLDANRFLSAPEFNSLVKQSFGFGNNQLPQTVALSPRLGFTWVYLKRRENRDKISTSRIATSYEGPRGTIRGGVGAFQNYQPPSLISPVLANTGLQSSASLFCIGTAVPRPEWLRYAENVSNIPRACNEAVPGLSDAARLVELFDNSFSPQRSWRANLSWTSALEKVDFSLEGIYSLNLNLPGTTDLNFSGAPKFTLPEENARRVYVSASQIIPTTGDLSPIEARLMPSFARVVKHVADGKSVTRQLTVVAVPALPITRFFVRGAYTLSDTRELMRGFDRSTFYDPRGREWAPSSNNVRHQFQIHVGIANPWLSVTSFTRLSSGSRFTPIIGGDVNGDGLALNDRAFIFDPLTLQDRRLASSLTKLIHSGPSSISECLTRQLGRPAGGNSCGGPWTAQMNAEMTLSPLFTDKLLQKTGNRMRVTLNLANPLAGLDQLLHGARLRGWGTATALDPILYRVRGFDPVTSRFEYDVNPNFGSSQPQHTTIRSPFRITIDVSMDIGRPVGEQQLDKWLKPGRAGRPGIKLGSDSLKRRYERNVPDIFGYILINGDSLLLSPRQVEALEASQNAFQKQMDSVWIGLASYMAELPDRYDSNAVLRMQETTLDQAWELAWRETKKLNEILSPVQLRLLPWPVSFLYSSNKAPKGFRMFLGG